MIIGVSGAQGAGKSTILNKLRFRGWIVDGFKVSRSVQQELGWGSLTRAEENVNDMIMLQETILEHKLQNDKHLAEHVNVYLTERTFADILAYASLWTWKLIDSNKWNMQEAMAWHREYIAKCRKAQNIYSGIILVPYMDHVHWENDPHRAAKADANRVYEDIESFCFQFSIPKLCINVKSVDDRVVQVEDFLNLNFGV